MMIKRLTMAMIALHMSSALAVGVVELPDNNGQNTGAEQNSGAPVPAPPGSGSSATLDDEDAHDWNISREIWEEYDGPQGRITHTDLVINQIHVDGVRYSILPDARIYGVNPLVPLATGMYIKYDTSSDGYIRTVYVRP